MTVPGTRFTYAQGKLLLWSPLPGYVDSQGDVLNRGSFRFLAIANPVHAPYGRAAAEVLQTGGLWDGLQGRMVRGENIGQAFQFVKSGNAQLGFIAMSQVIRPGQPVTGSYWTVPHTRYSPIEQQAVLLRDHGAARAFLEFVRTDEARALIRSFGYETP
jgi:molybdate transport system substrate-binding protein